MTHQQIAYFIVEAKDLLGVCLERFHQSKDPLELILRGTLPSEDLSAINSTFVMVDPNGLAERFDMTNPVFLESWSELFALGCLTRYCDERDKDKHWRAGIGIEKRFKESLLRERYLGDGIIACEDIKARQIVQECKAQNIKGKNPGEEIETVLIQRIGEKLNKHKKEKKLRQILVSSIFALEGGSNKIDLKYVYDETLGKAEYQGIFDMVFCIVAENNLGNVRVFRLENFKDAEEAMGWGLNINFNSSDVSVHE